MSRSAWAYLAYYSNAANVKLTKLNQTLAKLGIAPTVAASAPNPFCFEPSSSEVTRQDKRSDRKRVKKDRDSWCIKNTFQSVCVAKVFRPEKCGNFVALCHHGSQNLFLSLAPPTVQACPPMCIKISTESMCYDHMSSGTTRMDSVGLWCGNGALWLGDLVDRVFGPLEAWDSSCGKNPSREGAPWLWQWYDYDYDSIEV